MRIVFAGVGLVVLFVLPEQQFVVPIWATSRVVVGQQSGTQLPPFRARADLVVVDVSVVDDRGSVVTGLGPEDFRVYEDGVEQKITAFREVNPRSENWATPWLGDVSADVVSNDAVEGRLLAIVIDDALVPSDPSILQNARTAAKLLIDDLGPSDRATVVFTRDSRRAQPFTSDRSKLRAAVDAIDYGFLGMGGTAGKLGDSVYGMGSLRTLEDVVQVLGTSEHFPRSLVYISLGLQIEWDLVARPGQVGSPVLAYQQVQQSYADKLRSILRHAARLNIAIHSISTEGARGGGDSDTLRILANNTGGMYVDDTRYAAGVASILQASKSVYLIGYSPAVLRPGLRRTTVQVRRPGMEARTRSFYERLKDVEKSPPVSADVAALRGILPVSEMPLRVSAVPVFLGGRDAEVAIVLGVRHPSGGAKATEVVRLIVSAYDMEGRFKGATRGTATVKMADQPSEAAEYEVYSRVTLPPGRYQLRLSVDHRARGVTGSVFTDVVVPDFRNGNIHIEGPVIDAGPARLKAAPADLFTGLLPVLPTSQRDFRRGSRFSAFARVIQGEGSPLRPLTVMSSLRNAQGETIRRNVEALAATNFSQRRAAAYRLGITTDDLRPGWYLLSLEVQGPEPLTRAAVPFRIVQ